MFAWASEIEAAKLGFKLVPAEQCHRQCAQVSDALQAPYNVHSALSSLLHAVLAGISLGHKVRPATTEFGCQWDIKPCKIDRLLAHAGPAQWFTWGWCR